MVRGTEFAQGGGAHEFKEAQTGLAVLFTLKICVRLWQNVVSRIAYGTIALYVGIQQTVQIRGVTLELFQVAVRFIAGKGRRHHKRGMAEQVVFHVRLVDDLVLCTVEDAPDQLFIGGCVRQLPDGNLFQIDGKHPVTLPMPGRKGKGKQDIFLWQRRR